MAKIHMQVTMVLERETRGAYLFKEVDSEGGVIQDFREAQIGNMYLRKSSVAGKTAPKKIMVTVAVEEEV